MSTVPAELRVFNPGIAAKCAACLGTGRQGRGIERSPCANCLGSGTLVLRPHLAADRYVATTGGDVIDEGGPLARFVFGLQDCLELEDEDVAVWRVADGKAPRLVAYIRPTPGGNQVTWI